MGSWKTAFGSYLKSEDLAGREVRAVIGSVAFEEIKSNDGGKEQKLVAHFAGKDKGLVLNRTNAESIAMLAGTDEVEDWAGTQVVLWVDPNVTFGGKKVPAIRIKAPTKTTAAAPAPRQAPKQVEMPADEAPPVTDDDIPF